MVGIPPWGGSKEKRRRLEGIAERLARRLAERCAVGVVVFSQVGGSGVDAMKDLAPAYVVLLGLTLVALVAGFRVSRRWSRGGLNVATLLAVAGLLLFAFRYHGTWQMARLLPYSSVIVIGNWIPIGGASVGPGDDSVVAAARLGGPDSNAFGLFCGLLSVGALGARPSGTASTGCSSAELAEFVWSLRNWSAHDWGLSLSFLVDSENSFAVPWRGMPC